MTTKNKLDQELEHQHDPLTEDEYARAVEMGASIVGDLFGVDEDRVFETIAGLLDDEGVTARLQKKYGVEDIDDNNSKHDYTNEWNECYYRWEDAMFEGWSVWYLESLGYEVNKPAERDSGGYYDELADEHYKALVKEYGKKLADGANFGWYSEEDRICSKVYGTGSTYTTRRLPNGDYSHERND